jgi:pimeloyl-ACP methyl ester carboxylesterase
MSDPSKMEVEKHIDVDGIDTVYYEAGSGEPIVFIYGGNFGSPESASNAFAWKLNFGPLSRHHHVIAFDKVGQGRSGNPLRDEDYTMAAVIRHAARFIESLNLPPVHLVGHSRGGFAATRVALEYPQLVRSLTIVSSGTLSPRPSTNEMVLTKVPFPNYTRESARWVYEGYSCLKESVTDEWIEDVYQILLLPKYRETVQKMVNEGLGGKYFLPQLMELKRDTLNGLAEGRLQRPAQIIFGQNDPTVNPEGALDLFNMIAKHQRNAQVHIINKAGHFSYREHPERFNALVSRFVDYVAAH